MNQTVYYNPDSMNNLKKDINKYGNQLISNLDKLSLALDELDEIYNTPSGVLFKEKFKEYIEDRKKYIQDQYLSLEGVVNFAINEYDKNNSNIHEMVGGN